MAKRRCATCKNCTIAGGPSHHFTGLHSEKYVTCSHGLFQEGMVLYSAFVDNPQPATSCPEWTPRRLR